MKYLTICVFFNKYLWSFCLLYALLLLSVIIGVVFIERQRSIIYAHNAHLIQDIVEQKKKYADLEQMNQALASLIQDCENQKTFLSSTSLKQTCALLFAEHSEYAIDLLSYSYQLHNQIHCAQAHLKGTYHAIIDFCKAIHRHYRWLRCAVHSLQRTSEGVLEAQLSLSIYKDQLCV